jgi:gamma-glutamylcysteine synthetase
MAPAAFHAGLMENLHQLTKLLETDTVIYHHGYSPSELRELFDRREFPEFVDKKQLSGLLLQVLDLARKGLAQRGLHEEKYLDSLYERARCLLSPARQMVEAVEAGVPLESYINKYAAL